VTPGDAVWSVRLVSLLEHATLRGAIQRVLRRLMHAPEAIDEDAVAAERRCGGGRAIAVA
jgi:hypothetical protein